jgi:hypothetical protein
VKAHGDLHAMSLSRNRWLSDVVCYVGGVWKVRHGMERWLGGMAVIFSSFEGVGGVNLIGD